MNIKRTAQFALALMVCSTQASAWDDHDQLSYLILQGESWASEAVTAEPLETFIAAERQTLPDALARIEYLAVTNLDYYPPLPGTLAFKASSSTETIRTDFLRALRMNPESPIPLFIEAQAGKPRPDRPDLAVEKADPFKNRFPTAPFLALKPGDTVTALEVAATASDEPDYGLDIGLFANNGTDRGKEYGLGEQPYGNPALTYGSQAPFHMAFPSEDPVIKLAAGFTQQGLAAYRVLQCSELARFAFKTGHRYWGYRFAGWAAHYVQDMSQPYHTRVMPGKGTFSLLSLYLFGNQKDIDDTVVLLSNRHLVSEDWLYHRMATFADDTSASPVFKSLSAPSVNTEPWRTGYEYDVTARNAYRFSDQLNTLIMTVFAPKYVNDPSYDFGAPENAYSYDTYAALKASSGKLGKIGYDETMETTFSHILSNTRDSSRALFAYATHPEMSAGARRRPFDPRGAVYIAVPIIVLASLIWLIAFMRGKKFGGSKR